VTGAYQSGALYWTELAMTTNIIVGRNGLTEANTLAYFDVAIITAVKSFIVHGPDGSITNVACVNNPEPEEE
jgi:hypothetical protein